LLYRTNDIIIYTSKHILNRGSLITYKRWVINIVLFLSIVIIASKFNITPNSYVKFAITSVILLIIIVPIFFIAVSIFDIKSAKYTLNHVKKYCNLLILKFRG